MLIALPLAICIALLLRLFPRNRHGTAPSLMNSFDFRLGETFCRRNLHLKVTTLDLTMYLTCHNQLPLEIGVRD